MVASLSTFSGQDEPIVRATLEEAGWDFERGCLQLYEDLRQKRTRCAHSNLPSRDGDKRKRRSFGGSRSLKRAATFRQARPTGRDVRPAAHHPTRVHAAPTHPCTPPRAAACRRRRTRASSGSCSSTGATCASASAASRSWGRGGRATRCSTTCTARCASARRRRAAKSPGSRHATRAPPRPRARARAPCAHTPPPPLYALHPPPRRPPRPHPRVRCDADAPLATPPSYE